MRDAERKSTKQARTLRRKLTRAETILWQHLRRRALNDLRFRRQFPIGPYIADFACADIKLIVEVDGETHNTDAEMRHDQKRTAYIEERGWSVMRCWNNDIYTNLDGTLSAIADTARNLQMSRHA